MAMQDALNFFQAIRDDKDLRRKANNCATGQEFSGLLESEGYKFTPLEWENASTHLLFRAADEDEAEEIKTLKLWCEWHWNS